MNVCVYTIACNGDKRLRHDLSIQFLLILSEKENRKKINVHKSRVTLPRIQVIIRRIEIKKGNRVKKVSDDYDDDDAQFFLVHPSN